tara:strand:- start:11786 stop:22573 length:10788 start_codon:yes stop_codon:yes gene_type:complete
MRGRPKRKVSGKVITLPSLGSGKEDSSCASPGLVSYSPQGSTTQGSVNLSRAMGGTVMEKALFEGQEIIFDFKTSSNDSVNYAWHVYKIDMRHADRLSAELEGVNAWLPENAGCRVCRRQARKAGANENYPGYMIGPFGSGFSSSNWTDFNGRVISSGQTQWIDWFSPWTATRPKTDGALKNSLMNAGWCHVGDLGDSNFPWTAQGSKGIGPPANYPTFNGNPKWVVGSWYNGGNLGRWGAFENPDPVNITIGEMGGKDGGTLRVVDSSGVTKCRIQTRKIFSHAASFAPHPKSTKSQSDSINIGDQIVYDPPGNASSQTSTSNALSVTKNLAGHFIQLEVWKNCGKDSNGVIVKSKSSFSQMIYMGVSAIDCVKILDAPTTNGEKVFRIYLKQGESTRLALTTFGTRPHYFNWSYKAELLAGYQLAYPTLINNRSVWVDSDQSEFKPTWTGSEKQDCEAMYGKGISKVACTCGPQVVDGWEKAKLIQTDPHSGKQINYNLWLPNVNYFPINNAQTISGFYVPPVWSKNFGQGNLNDGWVCGAGLGDVRYNIDAGVVDYMNSNGNTQESFWPPEQKVAGVDQIRNAWIAGIKQGNPFSKSDPPDEGVYKVTVGNGPVDDSGQFLCEDHASYHVSVMEKLPGGGINGGNPTRRSLMPPIVRTFQIQTNIKKDDKDELYGNNNSNIDNHQWERAGNVCSDINAAKGKWPDGDERNKSCVITWVVRTLYTLKDANMPEGLPWQEGAGGTESVAAPATIIFPGPAEAGGNVYPPKVRAGKPSLVDVGLSSNHWSTGDQPVAGAGTFYKPNGMNYVGEQLGMFYSGDEDWAASDLKFKLLESNPEKYNLTKWRNHKLYWPGWIQIKDLAMLDVEHPLPALYAEWLFALKGGSYNNVSYAMPATPIAGANNLTKSPLWNAPARAIKGSDGTPWPRYDILNPATPHTDHAFNSGGNQEGICNYISNLLNRTSDMYGDKILAWNPFYDDPQINYRDLGWQFPSAFQADDLSYAGSITNCNTDELESSLSGHEQYDIAKLEGHGKDGAEGFRRIPKNSFSPNKGIWRGDHPGSLEFTKVVMAAEISQPNYTNQIQALAAQDWHKKNEEFLGNPLKASARGFGISDPNNEFGYREAVFKGAWSWSPGIRHTSLNAGSVWGDTWDFPVVNMPGPQRNLWWLERWATQEHTGGVLIDQDIELWKIVGGGYQSQFTKRKAYSGAGYNIFRPYYGRNDVEIGYWETSSGWASHSDSFGPGKWWPGRDTEVGHRSVNAEEFNPWDVRDAPLGQFIKNFADPEFNWLKRDNFILRASSSKPWGAAIGWEIPLGQEFNSNNLDKKTMGQLKWGLLPNPTWRGWRGRTYELNEDLSWLTTNVGAGKRLPKNTYHWGRGSFDPYREIFMDYYIWNGGHMPQVEDWDASAHAIGWQKTRGNELGFENLWDSLGTDHWGKQSNNSVAHLDLNYTKQKIAYDSGASEKWGKYRLHPTQKNGLGETTGKDGWQFAYFWDDQWKKYHFGTSLTWWQTPQWTSSASSQGLDIAPNAIRYTIGVLDRETGKERVEEIWEYRPFAHPRSPVQLGHQMSPPADWNGDGAVMYGPTGTVKTTPLINLATKMGQHRGWLSYRARVGELFKYQLDLDEGDNSLLPFRLQRSTGWRPETSLGREGEDWPELMSGRPSFWPGMFEGTREGINLHGEYGEYLQDSTGKPYQNLNANRIVVPADKISLNTSRAGGILAHGGQGCRFHPLTVVQNQDTSWLQLPDWGAYRAGKSENFGIEGDTNFIKAGKIRIIDNPWATSSEPIVYGIPNWLPQNQEHHNTLAVEEAEKRRKRLMKTSHTNENQSINLKDKISCNDQDGCQQYFRVQVVHPPWKKPKTGTPYTSSTNPWYYDGIDNLKLHSAFTAGILHDDLVPIWEEIGEQKVYLNEPDDGKEPGWQPGTTDLWLDKALVDWNRKLEFKTGAANGKWGNQWTDPLLHPYISRGTVRWARNCTTEYSFSHYHDDKGMGVFHAQGIYTPDWGETSSQFELIRNPILYGDSVNAEPKSITENVERMLIDCIDGQNGLRILDENGNSKIEKWSYSEILDAEGIPLDATAESFGQDGLLKTFEDRWNAKVADKDGTEFAFEVGVWSGLGWLGIPEDRQPNATINMNGYDAWLKIAVSDPDLALDIQVMNEMDEVNSLEKYYKILLRDEIRSDLDLNSELLQETKRLKNWIPASREQFLKVDNCAEASENIAEEENAWFGAKVNTLPFWEDDITTVARLMGLTQAQAQQAKTKISDIWINIASWGISGPGSGLGACFINAKKDIVDWTDEHEIWVNYNWETGMGTAVNVAKGTLDFISSGSGRGPIMNEFTHFIQAEFFDENIEAIEKNVNELEALAIELKGIGADYNRAFDLDLNGPNSEDNHDKGSHIWFIERQSSLIHYIGQIIIESEDRVIDIAADTYDDSVRGQIALKIKYFNREVPPSPSPLYEAKTDNDSLKRLFLKEGGPERIQQMLNSGKIGEISDEILQKWFAVDLDGNPVGEMNAKMAKWKNEAAQLWASNNNLFPVLLDDFAIQMGAKVDPNDPTSDPRIYGDYIQVQIDNTHPQFSSYPKITTPFFGNTFMGCEFWGETLTKFNYSHDLNHLVHSDLWPENTKGVFKYDRGAPETSSGSRGSYIASDDELETFEINPPDDWSFGNDIVENSDGYNGGPDGRLGEYNRSQLIQLSNLHNDQTFWNEKEIPYHENYNGPSHHGLPYEIRQYHMQYHIDGRFWTNRDKIRYCTADCNKVQWGKELSVSVTSDSGNSDPTKGVWDNPYKLEIKANLNDGHNVVRETIEKEVTYTIGDGSGYRSSARTEKWSFWENVENIRDDSEMVAFIDLKDIIPDKPQNKSQKDELIEKLIWSVPEDADPDDIYTVYFVNDIYVADKNGNPAGEEGPLSWAGNQIEPNQSREGFENILFSDSNVLPRQENEIWGTKPNHNVFGNFAIPNENTSTIEDEGGGVDETDPQFTGKRDWEAAFKIYAGKYVHKTVTTQRRIPSKPITPEDDFEAMCDADPLCIKLPDGTFAMKDVIIVEDDGVPTVQGEQLWMRAEGTEYSPNPCSGDFDPPTFGEGISVGRKCCPTSDSNDCERLTTEIEKEWIEIPVEFRRPGPFKGYKMDTLVPWCVLRNAMSDPATPWCAEDEDVNDSKNEGTPDELYFRASWPMNWSFFVRGHIAITKMKKRNAPGDVRDKNEEWKYLDPFHQTPSLYHRCIQNPPFVVNEIHKSGTKILKGQGESSTRNDFLGYPGWDGGILSPNPDFPFSRTQIQQNFCKNYWEKEFEEAIFYPVPMGGGNRGITRRSYEGFRSRFLRRTAPCHAGRFEERRFISHQFFNRKNNLRGGNDNVGADGTSIWSVDTWGPAIGGPRKGPVYVPMGGDAEPDPFGGMNYDVASSVVNPIQTMWCEYPHMAVTKGFCPEGGCDGIGYDTPEEAIAAGYRHMLKELAPFDKRTKEWDASLGEFVWGGGMFPLAHYTPRGWYGIGWGRDKPPCFGDINCVKKRPKQGVYAVPEDLDVASNMREMKKKGGYKGPWTYAIMVCDNPKNKDPMIAAGQSLLGKTASYSGYDGSSSSALFEGGPWPEQRGSS